METGEQGSAKEDQEKVVAPTAVLRALVACAMCLPPAPSLPPGCARRAPRPARRRPAVLPGGPGTAGRRGGVAGEHPVCQPEPGGPCLLPAGGGGAQEEMPGIRLQ